MRDTEIPTLLKLAKRNWSDKVAGGYSLHLDSDTAPARERRSSNWVTRQQLASEGPPVFGVRSPQPLGMCSGDVALQHTTRTGVVHPSGTRSKWPV